VEFDKIYFHEHACEIFSHSELKWPSYTRFQTWEYTGNPESPNYLER